MFYPVTLTKDTNGTYLATFPDVPGANTYGDTKEEALEHSLDALLSIFDSLMKDKLPIPHPSIRKGPVVQVPVLEASKLALYESMLAQKVSKSELGRRLKWHLPQVDRVLKVRHGSQMDQIEAALQAVGKRIRLTLEDASEYPQVQGGMLAAKTERVRRVRTKRYARKKR